MEENRNVKITASDCHEILRKKLQDSNYELMKFEIGRASEEKFGFMCEHHVLKIDVRCNDQTRQERFFVKSVPSNAAQRTMCIETKSCYKEETMFSTIRSTFLENGITIINDCIPECYIIGHDDFIVLEDLVSRGFKIFSPRVSLDFDTVKLAISTMAKFHACCLILEENLTKKIGKVYRMFDQFQEEFCETFYTSLPPCLEYMKSCRLTLSAQIKFFANADWGISPGILNQRAQNILDEFDEFVKPSTVFRNTMCHGDVWANNLMFRFENNKPVQCYLIDFQTYRYCPPAQDVMTFIYLSTDDAFRREYMQEALDYYYLQLGGILENYGSSVEKIVPRAEFVESCEFYKPFAVAQTVTHFHNIIIVPKLIRQLLESSESQDVFGGDRSEQFLEMCRKDAVYKEKQREALENLRLLCQNRDELNNVLCTCRCSF